MRATGLILFVVSAVSLLVPSAWGQAGAALPDSAMFIAPAEPDQVDPANLADALKPLTLEELGDASAFWLEQLKAAVAQESAASIAARGAEGDAGNAFTSAQSEAGLLKARLIDRLDVVIGAIERKGGDVTEFKAYRDAVSGAPLTGDDAGQTANLLMDWLTSSEGGVAVGLAIVKFVATLAVFYVISRILAGIVRAALKRSKNTSQLLRDFMIGAVSRVTLFIGVIVGISFLGVDIGPLVAAIGAAGLVVGFALQGTLSNFASGLLILFYKPFDVGDGVSAGGVVGKVTSMTLVSTVITTFDNQKIVVPNNAIWGNPITNMTGVDTRRVDLVFGIGYGDDMAAAEKIINDLIKGHDKILKTPEPVVKVSELADSSVNFVVRPWCKTSDYWDVYWDLTRTVKEQFDKQGIGIPFPQQDIHLPEAIEVKIAK